MKRFFVSDDFKRPGGEAESIVWEKIKEAFSDREVIGYSRYPFFAKVGEARKEPDLLLLDQEEGLIIIEVKGFCLKDIESVGPNEWCVINQYDRTVSPLQQAEDYAFSVIARLESERLLRGKCACKALVALPYISKIEWERRFGEAFSYGILFKEDMSKTKLINQIGTQEPQKPGRKLSDDEYSTALSILGYERKHTQQQNVSLPEGTKGSIYTSVKEELYQMDFQQEEIARNIPPGPQRIRGIAGSGKTLLICQKAAYMHLRYPHWKIAIVFATQSLYETITETVNSYIKYFLKDTEVDIYKSNGNLQILHAWGSNKRTGFLKEVAEANGTRNISATTVERDLGEKFIPQNIALNYIAKRLLEKTDESLAQVYDAILIDEGQDLVVDDAYKYEGKQPFYYLAYKSLKPINGDTKMRRLIWAYDELQTLQTRKIPSSKEIFGDSTLVTGKYKGGINKSYVMKKCYRTPKKILTTAHAVGMGLFRDKGLLSGYSTKEDWKAIGYQVVKGSFNKPKTDMIIERDNKYSPNPISKFTNIPVISFKMYKNSMDAFEELANDIYEDINKQGLNPSKDILIINLKEAYEKAYESSLIERLRQKGINIYIPSYEHINTWGKNTGENIPQDFWRKDAVTISRVERAKGNEAAMVYVIGLEEVAIKEKDLNARNKLFVALTRAKCWVKVMGTGSYPLYDEMKKSIESEGRFKFIYTKPSLDTNDHEVTDIDTNE